MPFYFIFYKSFKIAPFFPFRLKYSYHGCLSFQYKSDKLKKCCECVLLFLYYVLVFFRSSKSSFPLFPLKSWLFYQGYLSVPFAWLHKSNRSVFYVYLLYIFFITNDSTCYISFILSQTEQFPLLIFFLLLTSFFYDNRDQFQLFSSLFLLLVLLASPASLQRFNNKCTGSSSFNNGLNS